MHGFGFSFGLRQTLQFAGSHLLTSLLAFNAGVELGQIAVLLFLVPALALAFRFVVAERIGVILASALVAHTGWHWMIDRAERLRQYRGPAVDGMLVLRSLTAMVALAAVIWVLRQIRTSVASESRERSGAAGSPRASV
jgi:hypothetical protein